MKKIIIIKANLNNDSTIVASIATLIVDSRISVIYLEIIEMKIK